jgi:hypothetical protein
MKTFAILGFFCCSFSVVGQDATSTAVPTSTAIVTPVPVASQVNTIFASIDRPYFVTPPMAEGFEAQLKQAESQMSTTPFGTKDPVKVSLNSKPAKKSTPIKRSSATDSKKSTAKTTRKALQPRPAENERHRPLQDAIKSLFSKGNSRHQTMERAAVSSRQGSRSRQILNLGAQ